MNYEINDDAYYSREFDINDKKGYLKIEEKDNKYLINFYYNEYLENIV